MAETRTTRANGAGRRVALLDAAEMLFSRQGFYGTSMQQITSTAGVPHGLITYYFRSKDDLFRQVIERRTADIADLLVRHLDLALAREEAGAERVRSIAGAFLTAHFEMAARGEGETNYLRLTHQLIAFGKGRDLIEELTRQYDWVTERYRAALRDALPHVDAGFVRLRVHFMRLVLAGVLVDDRLPPPLSLESEHTDETIRILRNHCAHGFLGEQ